MSPKKNMVVEEDAQPRVSIWTRIARTLKTTAAALVILYVAFLLIVRTEGFRDIAAQRLGKFIGMPVTLGRIEVAWDFDVRLKDVASQATNEGQQASVRIGKASLDVNMTELLTRGRLTLRKVRLEDGALVFAGNEAGEWDPAGLAKWGTWMGKWLNVDLERMSEGGGARSDVKTEPASQPSKASKRERLPPAVALERGNISWWVGSERPLASVEGITMAITPLKAPHRTLTHYLLKFDRCVSADGGVIRNLNLELVDAGDQQVVLVLNAEREEGRGK